MMVRVERIPLSTRTEAARALAWGREAIGARDPRLLANLTMAGTANVAAAATDRWRRPQWWCPCCERTTSGFLTVGNHLRLARRARCPGCGAGSRHRGLALALRGVAGERSVNEVLHFAPEPPVTLVLDRQLPGARVVTTDRHRTDVDRPGEDVQDLTFPDAAVDLVLCNHVLEHVPDDRAAMAELARVTRPGGLAVISVPGDWGRQETVSFPPDQQRNGHHRDYGLDVEDALRAAFTAVDVVVFADLEVGGALPGDPGLRPDDRLFFCHR
jgi:SAM-dependent methyltransferase